MDVIRQDYPGLSEWGLNVILCILLRSIGKGILAALTLTETVSPGTFMQSVAPRDFSPVKLRLNWPPELCENKFLLF